MEDGLPLLEEPCPNCAATGWHNGVCGRCHGDGYLRTPAGEKVLAVLIHFDEGMRRRDEHRRELLGEE
jgi:hypothetical protein